MTPEYKARRAEKHHAQRMETGVTLNTDIDTSPDHLGKWEGGKVEMKGDKNWVSQKSHASRTADRKDSPSEVREGYEHSADFYHGAKRDPNYADRVALQELAAKIVRAPEDHGDVTEKGYKVLCKDVLRRDNYHCRACGYRDNLHVHHIVYRSHQGPDAAFNLITLCNECHEAVHRKDLELRQEGPVDANANIVFIRLNKWKPA